MNLIEKYFPKLTNEQYAQFESLNALYHEWNQKINVISRKDIDNLYEHHVLHSLAIGRFIGFKPGTQILDFGTGGGFLVSPWLFCFLSASSNSSTAQARRFVWRRRYATLSASRTVTPNICVVRTRKASTTSW